MMQTENGPKENPVEVQPKACIHCGAPTKEIIAGDPICLSCYSEAGACCHESEC